MHRSRRWWWITPLIVLVVLAGAIIWASIPVAAMPEANAATRSTVEVHVEKGPWLAFRPVGVEPTVGLIFYPGGKVDYRAYAPYAQAIASQGYLVVIVPMPFGLAVLAPGRASGVISAFPAIRHWAVGGHSLGGAMAARYAYGHPTTVRGLVLWASYPASSDDLSRRDLRVVSISGTRDGLATDDKIAASRPLLPANTQWVVIEGGNHGQFGWYGPQSGDQEATISREGQQEQTVAATTKLLADLAKGEEMTARLRDVMAPDFALSDTQGRMPALLIIDKAGWTRFQRYGNAMQDIVRNAKVLAL